MLKMICFCTERKTDKSAEITAVSVFKNIYPVFDFTGYKKSWHELLIMEGETPGGINTIRRHSVPLLNGCQQMWSCLRSRW